MTRALAFIISIALLVPLLFAPEAAAQPKAAGVGYELEDGTGDVSFFVVSGAQSPALPSAAHLPYLDFTGFKVADTNALNLDIRMKNQAGFAERTADTIIFGLDAYHSFSFLIPGTETSPAYGRLQVFSYFQEDTMAQAEGIVRLVEFCIVPSQTEQYCGYPQILPFTFEDGWIVIELPKTMLTRSGPFAQFFPHLPPKLRAGDALTRVEVASLGNLFGYISLGGESPNQLRDDVPNDGAAPDFLFENPSVTDDLKITLSQVGVVAGEENIVGVEIQNLAERKRLLNLVVDVLDMNGEWTIKAVPNITVRSFDVLNATLRITPPMPAGGPLPSVKFQLRAEVVTEPGVLAAVQSSLVASKPLERGEHKWYLHVGPTQGAFAAVPIEVFSFREGFASRSEVDPRARDDGGIPLFFGGGSNGVDFVASILTADGIPNPAILAGEPATSHLVIDAPFPMDVTVTTQVRTADTLIATGSAEAALSRGSNTIDVPMPLDPTALRLAPEHGQLQWDIVVHRPGIEGFALAFASFADSPTLLAKQSWFDIPLEREVVIPPDPDLPDVALTAADDLDAFINPGRRTVFEWGLQNEHTEVLELELVVENLTRQWDHSVAPATILRVPAGQSVQVAVILGAPVDAKEGEICELRLVVKEPGSGRVFAGGARRAIVTGGVDVENETFEVDEVGLAAIKKAEGKSPGLGVLAIVATASLAAAFHARRRRVAPD